MKKIKLFILNRKDEIGIFKMKFKSYVFRIKAQIQQLEKFSADVSHELKNPLTSLQSAMELIYKRKKLAARISKY